MSLGFSPLSTDNLPSLPPAYDGSATLSRGSLDATPLEEFEIEEDEVYEPLKRDSFFRRLGFTSKRLVFAFRERVLAPLVFLMAPLFNVCRYVESRYEHSISKLGNPLVVKRLLYVVFVVLLMYGVSFSENSEGVNGASGGAFSTGKFYDVDLLGNSLSSYIDAKTLKENTEYLSSMPHLAGSTGDLALARYVESYYSNNGVDAVDFHEFDTFLNFPKAAGTYLKRDDGSFEAVLYEGSDTEMQRLAFCPDSPSSNGEIHSHYVFGNYGRKQDFAKLHDAGIDLKGMILVLRYGGNYPEPNKVALAHQRGAKAVVFITPELEWAGKKHDDAIQKKNVGLTRNSPGDVLTPGWSSQDTRVTRLDWDASASTAKIPCIPVSWRDGMKLIDGLDSQGVDFGDGRWSGSGAASPKLKLRVSQEERKTHSIWDVVGSITGREQAGKGVIFGAARDSVCYGASTGASGTAVLLELAKTFTSLQRRYDWSPSRSIHFVSFDASEYNLAGSTEWIENKKSELQKEGFAYIDVSDIMLGDLLSVEASPLLQDLIKDEMKKVKCPDAENNGKSKMSLYDLYKQQNDGKDKISYNLIDSRDFLPFINLLNMPAMHIGFKSKDGQTPKHSCLDTFANFEKSGDSSMSYHIALVELLARIGLRLAEEPLIPYNFNTLISSLRSYKDDLERLCKDLISKERSDVVPQLEFESLRRGIDRLAEGSKFIEEFRKDWTDFIRSSSSLEPVMLASTRRSANDNMVAFNGYFVVQGERPPRTGYLNYLFGVPYEAPSESDNSYAWNTFPMVRDYAIDGDFGRAQFEMKRLANLLETAGQMLAIL